VVVSF